MSVGILSINFKTATIEQLEACACNKDGISDYLSNLVESVLFGEMIVLSTCNRIEWVFTSPALNQSFEALIHHISVKAGLSKDTIRGISSSYIDTDAYQYLFELVSGLHSMVLGENEILAQIKDSYAFCLEFGATKASLNKLFQSVIAFGKDVRTKTNISSGAHSISSIAIEAMKDTCSNFLHQPILLIGAGVMIQRALVKLSAMGHKSMWISNRTMSKAEELAQIYDLIVIPYASIKHELHRFSTIYLGIHSPNHLLYYQHFMNRVDPITIVDVSIPRSIHPNCKQLPNLNVISIDQLELVAKRTMQSRLSDIPVVETLAKQAINDFNTWKVNRLERMEWVSNYA